MIGPLRVSISARLCLVATVVCTLGGCSSGAKPLFEPFDLEDATSVAAGSRERFLLNTSPQATPRPGLVQPKRIVCAEPSPDVAVAVANSFGSSLPFGGGSIAISASQAEGLIQLAERTVAVQLLRDQMYRACEAYANGAITGTTYSLITSKNNKTMVSLMLGETAGGAVGRKLGALGGRSTSEARALMKGLLENTDAARKAADDLKQAENELRDAEALSKNDETRAGRIAAARKKRDDAAQELQRSTFAASNTAAEFAAVDAGGEIDIQESAELAVVLKEMQEQFLNSGFLEDFVSTCVVELGLNSEQGHYFDPVNVAFRTKHLEYARKLKELGSEDAEPARRTLETALIRLNDSYLSRLCKQELPFLLKTQQQHNFASQSKELQISLVSEKRSLLEQYQEAMQQCEKLKKGNEAVSKCRQVASAIVEPQQQGVSSPSEPNGDEHLTGALGKYNAVRKAYLEVKALKTEADRLSDEITHASGEGREVEVGLEKEDKRQLENLRASFEQNYDEARSRTEKALELKAYLSLPAKIFGLDRSEPNVSIDRTILEEIVLKADGLTGYYKWLSRKLETANSMGRLYLGALEHIRNLKKIQEGDENEEA